MNRKQLLQVALGIVGSLFLLGVLALVQWNQQNVFPQMLASVYATLGVFLLLAIRNPSAHRSLISFTAWSSFVHGGVMAIQAIKNLIPRVDLWRAVLPLFVVGVLLVVLAPERDSREMKTATSKDTPLRPISPNVASF